MGHFLLENEEVQLHLYCRDSDTYGKVLEAAGEEGPVRLVRSGEETKVAAHPLKVHLYLRGSRVFAVNHEGSNHPGRTWSLPAPVKTALASSLPQVRLPRSGRVATAPFGRGMLQALTDF